jgi:peptide/nickel transport system permease protein
MAKFIVRRLLVAIPLIFFVSLAGFGVSALIRGDPAMAVLGPDATPEQRERISEELRLDDPLPERYAVWLGNVVQWDFGESIQTGRSITEEIGRRLPVTASIAGGALLFSLLLGLPFGLLQGAKPGSWIDKIGLGIVSLGLATPGFWIAATLITVFAINLKWLPALGFTPFSESPRDWFEHAIMPIIAIGVVGAAEVARQVRTGVVGAMSQDYIRGARARGVSETRIVAKHALKNGAMPALTLVGLRVGHMLAGSVVIETMFSIPGMGSYTYQAIQGRDIQVIQGVVVVFALLVLTLNLLADIGYALLDPKVRMAQR